MRRFEKGQRVVVDQPHFRELRGKLGTVARIRRDNGAWVQMDDPLPDDLRAFPEDDPHDRGRHVILYPSECSPEAIADLVTQS